MKDIDTPKVFISYSSHNSDDALGICSFLESNGIKCWIAPRDIRPGAAYPNEITRGIKECSTFLVILSKESVSSPHVNTETDLAFNNNKEIIPFFIDQVELGDGMTYYLARKQWILGYRNHKEALDTLLESLSSDFKSDNLEDSFNTSNSTSSYYHGESLLKENHILKWNNNIFRGYTKSQLWWLGSTVVLLLLLFPLLGLILVIISCLYPKKIQSLLHKHRIPIIITVSIIVIPLTLCLSYLCFDRMCNKKSQLENTCDISEGPEKKQGNTEGLEANTVTEDFNLYEKNDDNIRNSNRPKKQETLRTSTIINGTQCVAKWEIIDGEILPALKGHIEYELVNANDIVCNLALNCKTLEVVGGIEDKEGAIIGYFSGILSFVNTGYQIKGNLLLEEENYSDNKYLITIDILSHPKMDELLGK